MSARLTGIKLLMLAALIAIAGVACSELEDNAFNIPDPQIPNVEAEKGVMESIFCNIRPTGDSWTRGCLGKLCEVAQCYDGVLMKVALGMDATGDFNTCKSDHSSMCAVCKCQGP